MTFSGLSCCSSIKTRVRPPKRHFFTARRELTKVWDGISRKHFFHGCLQIFMSTIAKLFSIHRVYAHDGSWWRSCGNRGKMLFRTFCSDLTGLVALSLFPINNRFDVSNARYFVRCQIAVMKHVLGAPDNFIHKQLTRFLGNGDRLHMLNIHLVARKWRHIKTELNSSNPKRRWTIYHSQLLIE